MKLAMFEIDFTKFIMDIVCGAHIKKVHWVGMIEIYSIFKIFLPIRTGCKVYYQFTIK